MLDMGRQETGHLQAYSALIMSIRDISSSKKSQSLPKKSPLTIAKISDGEFVYDPVLEE